jgi:hypothetical protein
MEAGALAVVVAVVRSRLAHRVVVVMASVMP